MPLTKSQESVVAILSELQDAGIKSVTTTVLVKLVYLVDYYQAKETQGKPLTGVDWKFLHYGPYAPSLAADFDFLSQRGVLEEETSKDPHQDFYLYSLAESATRTTFESIGLIKRAATNLRPVLAGFCRALPNLLNFVYYHTEPMAEALPGSALDFSTCRQDLYADTKPVVLTRLPAQAIRAYKAKLEQRRVAKLNRPKVEWSGLYDDIYFQGMAYLDALAEDEATGRTGVLAL